MDSLQLTNIMGTLQNAMDTFFARFDKPGFKSQLIRKHLRTAYEHILRGDYDRALTNINLAEEEMA